MNLLTSPQVLCSFAFVVGLGLGVWQGIEIGRDKGRKAEKRQVIAFLVGAFRSESRESPEELAKAVGRLEHRDWDLKPRGRAVGPLW